MSDDLIGRAAEALRAESKVSEPAATAARWIGRMPTAAEEAEAAIYDDLRMILRAAREDFPLTQKAVAQSMNIPQSEVSRLETTIGPGTRFGRLCKYLHACGAELVLNVSTAQGRRFTWNAGGSGFASAGSEAAAQGHMREPGANVTAAGQLQMLDDILALDEALYNVEVSTDDVTRIRQAFLNRLRQRQGSVWQQTEADANEQGASPVAEPGWVHG